VGAGFLTPFELLRIDVARGLRHGRWMFSIDVSRQFWSVL
jgi:outer membrane translocation and assembly module TamA